MNEFSTFKTALVGGFDKDDVILQLKNMKEEAQKEKDQLKKQLEDKEIQIRELQGRLNEKERESESLKEDINAKYKKYEENYNSISKLVFDAQIKADRMKQDTQIQCEQMLDNAKEEAQKLLGEVEKEVDVRLAEGRKKYTQIQREIADIAISMGQIQNKFMASYRDINEIMEAMPEDFQEIPIPEDYMGDAQYEAAPVVEKEERNMDMGLRETTISTDFDEYDALDEAQKEIELQLHQFLADDDM